MQLTAPTTLIAQHEYGVESIDLTAWWNDPCYTRRRPASPVQLQHIFRGPKASMGGKPLEQYILLVEQC
eukprot:14290403-Ditylum_brightwellii.AAC.1